MIKKSIVGLVVCFLVIAGSAWAQTYPVLDTGDPAERVCNPKSYTDLGNGIVRDNVTGLEWMKGTAQGVYTWQQALNYCANLELGSYSDWRLPTIKELSTLVDAGQYNPAIDPVFNPVVSSYAEYWSSTTEAGGGSYAWSVHFDDGFVNGKNWTLPIYVRAVRGGPLPDNNFIDNGDGTVSDTSTGLMWQKATAPSPWTYTWQQALAYCEGLTLAGYHDWRLPDRNELQSIVDYSIPYPGLTINTVYFPNTVSDTYYYYWSSTTRGSNTGHAWMVWFKYGAVTYHGKVDVLLVRAVRGGPCWVDEAECLGDSDCGGATPVCDETNNTCEACLVDGDCGGGFCVATECVDCRNNADCPEDGNYCNGEQTCSAGVCGSAGNPCGGATPVCDENSNQCVECLVNGDCPAGSECINGACDQPPIFQCEPLWYGAWVGLSSDPANPNKPQSQHVLFWAYDDDKLACTGGVELSWMYRPVTLQEGVVVALGDWVVKGEPWRFLWYAWIETPGIAEIAGPGLFEFKMTATDCLDQEIDSEGFWSKRYYFQVD